ncbi:sensor histidine kinase YesM [Lewinella marina]|uniref:Histidine kinase n=1 Tax=Neolewinella marina TaxID=438751 RepID=A0A2G0CHB8_9BACT|nr:histidine kinase [Neolewinella marina]NJB86149.1 sensor histidine kinase YesM [Neolewinella marina]PHK99373.1 histidine kinase [Neolewinella marina]
MPARSPITASEIGYQLLLHLVVFLFYAFDRTSPHLEPFEVTYFIQYTLATLLISYWLLPRYIYRHRYGRFLLGVATVIVLVIVTEELILEPIYFAGKRAGSFPGVLFTLSQILPIMTILAAGKFAWDAARGQREVQQLRSLMQESELEFLKSQINPHFLFNNLNNLYSYAIEQSPKTPEIILELSAVLRYMIYECRQRYVPLSREIEQLRNFTRLYELQIEDRGEVSFQAPVSAGNHRIAPLILLVFIENAFKHGQAGQSDNIRIDIDLRLTPDGTLVFRCANDYAPVIADTPAVGGIGLANVRKRLQLLYPGPAHELRIEDSGTRFVVHLRLQLTSTAAP